MPDLSFSQPERRNFLVPVIAVAVIVAIAFALIWFFTPHRVVDAQVTHIAVYPIHTVIDTEHSNGSRIVGKADPAEDDIYVLATVRIHDDLRLPLFINDLTGTLITQDGAEADTTAVQKNDLPSVYQAFPAVKALSGSPLLRETEIAPGATAEGMVMLQYQLPESTWKQRKSASITIAFYHQDSITVPIPPQ